MIFPKHTNYIIRFAVLGGCLTLFFTLNLFLGSVYLPARTVMMALTGEDTVSTPAYIVLYSRLPAAVMALLAGCGLSVSGLMLQTAFRNALAGPSVLGLTSGAGLGVALVMLGTGTSMGVTALSGQMLAVPAAFAGCIGVTALLLLIAQRVQNGLMLLISGIMIGYLTSAIIMVLNFKASAEGIQSYVMWGMGTLGNVSAGQLHQPAILTAAGIAIAASLTKPLNLLVLGPSYARALGVNIRLTQSLLLLATGILTATATAFCGPISFIGLAVPHLARLIFKTDDHRLLMPATALAGSLTLLACNVVCTLPHSSVMPLNAVTPFVGVPVILWILLRKRH